MVKEARNKDKISFKSKKDFWKRTYNTVNKGHHDKDKTREQKILAV
jgi:hypothetical protein